MSPSVVTARKQTHARTQSLPLSLSDAGHFLCAALTIPASSCTPAVCTRSGRRRGSASRRTGRRRGRPLSGGPSGRAGTDARTSRAPERPTRITMGPSSHSTCAVCPVAFTSESVVWITVNFLRLLLTSMAHAHAPLPLHARPLSKPCLLLHIARLSYSHPALRGGICPLRPDTTPREWPGAREGCQATLYAHDTIKLNSHTGCSVSSAVHTCVRRGHVRVLAVATTDPHSQATRAG